MIKVVHYPYHFLNQQQRRSKVSSNIKYKFRGGTGLRRLRVVSVGCVSLMLCGNGGSISMNGVIVSCICLSYIPDLAFADIGRF